MKILITIHGMGDPDPGSSISWAKTLLQADPKVTGEANGTLVYRVPHQDSEVYAMEIFYDNWNQMYLQKRQAIGDLTGLAPGIIKKKLDSHLADVFQNVLTDATRQTSALQVLKIYSKALKFALTKNPGINISTDLKIGMLCHSLGTYLIYEGCYTIANNDMLNRIVPSNVVLCSPMLSPIRHVQKALNVASFLTKYGNKNPNISGLDIPFVKNCLAICNRHDPFFIIQNEDDYQPGDGTFVTEFHTFTEGKRFMPKNHGITDSYLKYNREKIIDVLWR